MCSGYAIPFAAKFHKAGIANLSTHLRIKWCLGSDEPVMIRSFAPAKHGRFHLESVITYETAFLIVAGVHGLPVYFGVIAGEPSGATGTFALLFHFPVETLQIDCQTVFARHQFSQIQWESKSIIEFKDIRTGYNVLTLLLQFDSDFLEKLNSFVKGTTKTFFFGLNDLNAVRLALPDFRVGISHDCCQIRYQLVKKRINLSESPSEAGGSSENAAQYIRTPLVTRQCSISNGESQCPDMVRNGAHGNHIGRIGIFAPGCSFDRGNEGGK